MRGCKQVTWVESRKHVTFRLSTIEMYGRREIIYTRVTMSDGQSRSHSQSRRAAREYPEDCSGSAPGRDAEVLNGGLNMQSTGLGSYGSI